MRPGNSRIEKKVIVGTVVKPVGLRGELKIKPLTDNPERYAPGGRLWFTAPGGDKGPFTIADAFSHKDDFKVTLDGIGSVEEAEEFRGLEVFVPESDVPPLPEGEYYHFQILGLPVYTHGGRLLGTVEDIFPAGEKDVYVVRGRGKAGEVKEYLVPVNEDTVREIDVKGGKITLYPMDDYIPEDEDLKP